MNKMMKNPLTRLLYFCWKYYNFKISVTFGTTFIFMYVFMTMASGRAMSGLKSQTASLYNDSLKELGFIDFMLNLYNQLTYLVQVVTGLGATSSFIFAVLIFGIVCAFSIGAIVWFAFEITYFIKVILLKQNKDIVFKDLIQRIEKSMKENEIK